MNQSDIEHMAQGLPPSVIGKDHEEVVIWMATQLLDVQQKLGVAIKRGDACMQAEMVWEKAMMAAIGEDGVGCVVKAIAALKAERDALAAENAALKSNLMFWDAEDPESPYDSPEDIANNCGMDFNTEFEVQVAAKMPNRTYRVSEVGHYDCKIELVSGAIPETPATDAYLNPVRAEGIIMFVSKQLAAAGNLDSTITLERLMLDAEEFAGQLRGSKGGE